MQEEKREEITLHLKRLDKRFSREPESRVTILEEMMELFQKSILKESERANWMLCWSSFTLLPQRELLEEEYENYLNYAMIIVLLGRYKRKRKRLSQNSGANPERERRPKWNGVPKILSLRPLRDESEKVFSDLEYKHHYPENFVDRANFKLTFTLRDFVLSAKEICGGSFTWLSRGERGGECWFWMTNGTIYIDDPSRFHSITIYHQSQQNSLELDGAQFLTPEGRLDLSGYFSTKDAILIRAQTDLRVVFPTGKRSFLKIKSQSSCKFDLDPCLLEYYSKEWYPFPYRFYVTDVDHLLNLERMISGRPLKPVSPNSAQKIAKGHGFHDSMERLKTLRRMKVDQSLSHPVPFFSLGNKSLSIVKEQDSLILYEDNYSLARCTLRPEKRVILLDMIDSHASEFIQSDKIYRYPHCLTMY